MESEFGFGEEFPCILLLAARLDAERWRPGAFLAIFCVDSVGNSGFNEQLSNLQTPQGVCLFPINGRFRAN